MQNDFEKDITQRLQDFSLAPQPEIWQRVEAALPPQKKRRRLVFWWWLPVAVVLLAGGIWMMGRKPKATFADTTQVPVHQNIPATPNPKAQTILSKKSVSQPANKQNLSIQTANSSPSKKQSVKKEEPDAEPGGIYEDGLTFTVKRSDKPSIRVIKNTTTNTVLSPAVSAGDITTGQFIPQEKKQLLLPESKVKETASLAPVSAVPQNSVAALQAKKDSTPATDSAAIALQKTDTTNAIATDTVALKRIVATRKQADQKKSPQWMLEAAVGVSNTHQFTGGNSNARYSNFYTGNPSATPVTGQPFDLPQSSYSLSLGVSKKMTFTPHWNGQLALSYHLLSSLQHYDSLVRAAYSSQGAAAGSAYDVYTAGNSYTHHNYVHQLQLTPRIAYIINPRVASPIDFHTGFSIAYNFAGNQLLHDYRTRTYIHSAYYSTRWLLSAEIGAGIFIHQKIYTGITYQHGLSNVARPALQSNFRWRVWQVQLGIPLFNRSSK